MRNIIVHYHFFKNAGTSFDKILTESFPCKWNEREFKHVRSPFHAKEVEDWIISTEDCIAFSSHTVQFPIGEICGVKVIPFFFLRHPIARLRSVYDFEKKQEPRLTFGARLAEKSSFAQYIEGCLTFFDDKQCRNYHCHKLVPGDGNDSQIFIAAVSIIESIECFGIVNRFGESVALFGRVYGDAFPDFISKEVRENVTAMKSEEDAIEEMKVELGADLFKSLIDANHLDIRLYEYAVKRFSNLVKT